MPLYVTDTEKIEMLEALDKFKTAMFTKLIKKQNLGMRGWREKSMRGIIGKKIQEHIKKGFKDQDNIIDTANLLMFLWYQKNETQNNKSLRIRG